MNLDCAKLMTTGLKIMLGVIIAIVVLVGGCVVITGGLFTFGLKKVSEAEDADRKRIADAMQNDTAIKADVSKFLSEYNTNKLAADEKYLNKVLTLTGTISDISDSLGQLSVSLAPDNKSFASVSCFFDDADRSKLIKLTKGQQASITGICLSGSLITKCKIR